MNENYMELDLGLRILLILIVNILCLSLLGWRVTMFTVAVIVMLNAFECIVIRIKDIALFIIIACILPLYVVALIA